MPPKAQPQSKAKTIRGPALGTKTRAVPDSLWKKLSTATEGADLSTILERWGADTAVKPVITSLVTVLPASGRIKGSRLVTRGPLFKANKVPASVFWGDLQGEYVVSFTIQGDTLDFTNPGAKNFSHWQDLRDLHSFILWKGNEPVSPEEANSIDPIKNGALFRVMVVPWTSTHMAIRLFVAPTTADNMATVAEKWNMEPDSADFPAVDITSKLGQEPALVEYLPQENPGHEYGMGLFPILEMQGTDEDQDGFPSSHAVHVEFVKLMWDMLPANPVKMDEFPATLAKTDCPATKESLSFKWPSAGKAVSKTSRTARRSGKLQSSLSTS